MKEESNPSKKVKRMFVPPEASKIFKGKIAERMGQAHNLYGAEKKFSIATGVDHCTLRQWATTPIIPFLFAEFLAGWFDVDLHEMMKWGVRLSLKVRTAKNQIRLKAPNLEIIKNRRFQLVSELLDARGYPVAYVPEGEGVSVPVPSIILGDIVQIYKTEQDRAKRLIDEYGAIDCMKQHLRRTC